MEDGGWVSIYEDITERRRGEKAIEEQNRRFDAALSNMSQGLLMFDAEARLIVRNPRYLEIYGLSAEDQPLGATDREIAEVLVSRGIYVGENVDRIVESTRAAVDSGRTLTAHRELADGRTVHVTHRPMAGGGWVTTFEDVTESRRVEASIRHMAHHDALTDLANRLTFARRVEQALVLCKQDRRPLAIFSIDLDRFKAVNDTLGHPVGDSVLQAVATRLRAMIREGSDTAARVGGDEFSVMLVGMDKAGADQWARRLIDTLSQPYAVDGHQVGIGASIGIALAPEDGLDLERLVKNADLALYRAKQESHGYRFFEAQMDTNRRLRHALEIDLRDALSRHELELFYQPVMALRTGRIGGFEALLRWRCPIRGMVLPSDFISVAEDTNLIVPIGEWALLQACGEAASWPDGLHVSVNVSAVQFRRGDFAQTVRAALTASGLEAQRLELEITETVLMDQTEAVLQTLRQLRKMKVRIALDDFGTGYSSLSYLRKFPFDRIKIDRSFTAEIDRAGTAAIVSAIVGLGEQLGMAVTAEGVETSSQLALMRAAGCTDAQGYLIGEPGPANGIEAMLAQKRTHGVG
jgi:diguanylate cyclase (GGDEF)-like protein